MMQRLFDRFFGCLHSQTSFPMTRRDGVRSSTAIVCTDCGREWAYDWATMQRGAEIVRRPIPGPVELARRQKNLVVLTEFEYSRLPHILSRGWRK